MNLTGKIWKALLWSAVGYVAWLVIDHYAHVGMPSHDQLTNFLVFVAIGGVIYLVDQRKDYIGHWLIHPQRRGVVFAIGWAASLPFLVSYYRAPAFAYSALPVDVPTPLPVMAAVGLFVLYQGYCLLKWVLF